MTGSSPSSSPGTRSQGLLRSLCRARKNPAEMFGFICLLWTAGAALEPGGFGVLKMSGCSRSLLRLLQKPRMGYCSCDLLWPEKMLAPGLTSSYGWSPAPWTNVFWASLCRDSSGAESQESVLSLGAAPAPERIPEEGQMEPMEQAGFAAGLFWQEIRASVTSPGGNRGRFHWIELRRRRKGLAACTWEPLCPQPSAVHPHMPLVCWHQLLRKITLILS